MRSYALVRLGFTER